MLIMTIVSILDILNCMINDHNCSQICVEVEGSFNCSCYPGYELLENEITCIGTYIRTFITKIYVCTCIHAYVHV